jgi:ribosome-associated toxin RatA of RatAB toxin-antitoxin module
MPVVEASIEISTPRDKLFALSQDYYLRKEWDPFVRELLFLNGAKEAANGVTVLVKAKNGFEMKVEYIMVQPPERVAVKMIEGPKLFTYFAGSWYFEAITPEKTEVNFRYNFQTRWPLLRPVLDKIIGLIFQRDIRKRLLGMKKAVETTNILNRE